MQLVTATRPLNYFEILGLSLKLSQKAFLHSLGLACLLTLAVFLPRLICVAIGQNVYLLASFHHPLQLATLFILYLCILWFLAAVFWRVYCVAKQKKDNYISDFQTASRRILYLVGAGIILLFISMALMGFILGLHWLIWKGALLSNITLTKLFFLAPIIFLQAIVPFYIVLLFTFYFPLIVIENDKIFAALKESAQLVWGQGIRTTFVMATPWVIYLAVILIIRDVFHIPVHLYFTAYDAVPLLGPTLLLMALFTLFTIWGIALTLIQLWDLEVRHKERLTNEFSG